MMEGGGKKNRIGGILICKVSLLRWMCGGVSKRPVFASNSVVQKYYFLQRERRKGEGTKRRGLFSITQKKPFFFSKYSPLTGFGYDHFRCSFFFFFFLLLFISFFLLKNLFFFLFFAHSDSKIELIGGFGGYFLDTQKKTKKI